MHYRSVRVAERLAPPTSDHGVAGSNPAGGEILPEPKRRFIAQSLSCSPFHHLEMTEILLKGRKTLAHPSISALYSFYSSPEELLYYPLRLRQHPQMLKFYVKVFKTSLFSNHMMDLVHIWYDDRYWSKILWGAIPTSVHDLKVKVTDLEFLC